MMLQNLALHLHIIVFVNSIYTLKHKYFYKIFLILDIHCITLIFDKL